MSPSSDQNHGNLAKRLKTEDDDSVVESSEGLSPTSPNRQPLKTVDKLREKAVQLKQQKLILPFPEIKVMVNEASIELPHKPRFTSAQAPQSSSRG